MSDPGSDLSKEEALALQKIRICQEMQEEITSWAKKRFAMVGIFAAVLGFFGITTVMHQSMQILLAKPVEDELGRFEDVRAKLELARDEARNNIFKLSLLSEGVREQGEKAKKAAAEAESKIDQLESSITEGNQKVVEINSAFDGIRESMRLVSGNVFDLASVSSDKESRLRADIHKANRTLDALERLAFSIAENFKTTDVEAALKQFHSDTSAINAEYVGEYNRINKMRTFNIVFYVDQKGDDTIAKATVEALKRAGYRAAVWYAQGQTRAAVIKEISKEFGDISDVLESNYRGIIADPAHGDIAGEVEELLVSTHDMKDLTSIRRPLHPAPIHLQRGQDENSFEADRVILIYSLSQPGT